MGLWEILKGILPEALIKIEDNRKIEINAKSVSIGNETINDPKLVKTLIYDGIKKFEKEETLPFQVVHKDIADEYIEYEEVSISQKESLEKLKTVLPDEEVECILVARRLKLAYDKGDNIHAKKIQKQFYKEYPGKGYKIYNLLGGGYFDEMILPFIDIFKSHYGDKYVEEYRKFYYGIIKFFPLAFFIGNTTTEEQIIKELKNRLKLNVPFVRLHAIGGLNIEKVMKVIDKLDINDNYSTSNEIFTTPGGLKAQIFEIKIKKPHKQSE